MTTQNQAHGIELSSSRTDRPIVMYTTSWCGDCRRAKRVFAALHVPYDEINIDEQPAAAVEVTRLNHGLRSVPTILFPDGVVLVEPSDAALRAKLAPFVESSR
jgi:mycoredoxin